MEDRPTLLFGWYNGSREEYSKSIKGKGYSVTSVGTLDEMKELAEQCEYKIFIMHSNLGVEGSHGIEGALAIYQIISSRVNNGSAKLYAASSVFEQSSPPNLDFLPLNVYSRNFLIMGENELIEEYINGDKLF